MSRWDDWRQRAADKKWKKATDDAPCNRCTYARRHHGLFGLAQACGRFQPWPSPSPTGGEG